MSDLWSYCECNKCQKLSEDPYEGCDHPVLLEDESCADKVCAQCYAVFPKPQSEQIKILRES